MSLCNSGETREKCFERLHDFWLPRLCKLIKTETMKNNFCDCCEQEIDQDLDFWSYDRNDEILCEECYNQAMDRSTVIQTWSPQDQETKKYYYPHEIGKAFNVYWEEIYSDDDEHHQPVEDCKWVNSSAWRGYMDVEFKDGWKDIESGWATGYWEDVSWKHKFNDLVGKIIGENSDCPVMVSIVSSLTSNVFSQATSIVVRSKDEETFLDWLENEYGMTREELKTSLK